jgi:hypothetical protein
MNDEEMTNGQIITKGGVGAGASFGAWLVAHVQEINQFLQSGCLVLGLAISSITLFKLVCKAKSKNEK